MSLLGFGGAGAKGTAPAGRARLRLGGGRDGRQAFGGELRARRRRIGVWRAGWLGGGGSGAQRAALGHRPIIPARGEFFFTAPATRSRPAQRARVSRTREAVNFRAGREHQAVLLEAARGRGPERQEQPREVVGTPGRLESRR
ncbi:hypothetical protein HCJ76_42550 [Streptomyces sp. MC1]|uniref:hypothetical protein n=1 Tax=Streptomyces sp. MC1 TaxID=295105 RepID=UPI0018C94A2F|nr:hypothetical protein [Streptomyces sp. MC1]MBG7704598.1 hypothetical protein [Streptomyces sp. MC1]